MKKLPTKSDFGDPRDLDVRYAWKTFGTKTIEEAYLLFKQNAFGCAENFRWMATAAFTFYFPIVPRYLMSPEAKGDSDTISTFIGILEDHWQSNAEELKPIHRQIEALCCHVVSHYDDYDLDYNIYGDVKSRYERMRTLVEQRDPSNPHSPSALGADGR